VLDEVTYGSNEEMDEQQLKRIAYLLIDAAIQMVFVFSPKMKAVLKYLPEQLIGEGFEQQNQLVRYVDNAIQKDDVILVIGADIKKVSNQIVQNATQERRVKRQSYYHPFATKAGAATYNLETHQKVGCAGNQQVEQNEG